ncbi:MAG: L-2-amino-thiazoline-4-carboxylic acid hydrolase [Anaerolineae bacterium]
MSQDNSYYQVRLPVYLQAFERDAVLLSPPLAREFGPGLVGLLIKDAGERYRGLIPQLPYIGGKQPFTRFLVSTALSLAIYQAVTFRGLDTPQAGRLLYRIFEAYLQATPAYLRLFRGMNFSPLYLWRLRRRAEESQPEKYPGDYVYRYIPGDGVNFTYGVDYEVCGGCRFLEQQGAPELAPYLCAADVLYSRALGWGLTRTQTLAEGADRCDFRFTRRGPTRIAVPQELKDLAYPDDRAGQVNR